MRMRLVVLAGFVCTLGFANVSIAQQQSDAIAPAAAPTAAKSPQVAVLTGQFHVLDAQQSNRVEVVPPGTIDDDSDDISTDRIATDAPRSLQSVIR